MFSTWKRKSPFWIFALASREIVTCVDTQSVSPAPLAWRGVLAEPIAVFSTLNVPRRPVLPDSAGRARCVEADPQLLEDTQAYLRSRSQRRAPGGKWRRECRKSA